MIRVIRANSGLVTEGHFHLLKLFVGNHSIGNTAFSYHIQFPTQGDGVSFPHHTFSPSSGTQAEPKTAG